LTIFGITAEASTISLGIVFILVLATGLWLKRK
jgi:hypothetical protein